MALIIPENIPSKSSKGVLRLFSALSRLPDDYLVYYEPLINPARPDFIIISPYLGLLVIEIRNWYPKQLQKVSKTKVYLGNNGEITEINPLYRAEHFLKDLVKKARKNQFYTSILENISIRDGFRFPSGALLILPNCTVSHLLHHPGGNLYDALGSDHILGKEKFSSIEEWDTVDLLRFLKSCVSPHGGNIPLTCEQIHLIRAIIHEEIVVDHPLDKCHDPAIPSKTQVVILDRDQERVLHRISSGHHLLYGPAGSGKSTIMESRCAMHHNLQKDARILVLCNSEPIRAQLSWTLKKFHRIQVFSFQNWAEYQGVFQIARTKNPESDQELGERCFDQIKKGNDESHAYDAVFIDEGNTFAVSWFRCAREALKDPDHGYLCIVSDGQKGSQGPDALKWQDIGIHIHGHIHHLGITSEKKYQNTREILKLARLFLLPEVNIDDEYRKLAFLCECQTRDGLKPLLIWNTSHEHQVEYATYLVQRLLSSIKSAQYLTRLKPEDIAILYPYAEGADKYFISSMIPLLSRICPVQWVSEESTTYERVNFPGLKVHDCYSIRGFFYRVVMIIFAENFERFFSDSEFFSGRNFFYMALTRPLDYLTIQYTDRTELIRKILDSGYVDEFVGK